MNALHVFCFVRFSEHMYSFFEWIVLLYTVGIFCLAGKLQYQEILFNQFDKYGLSSSWQKALLLQLDNLVFSIVILGFCKAICRLLFCISPSIFLICHGSSCNEDTEFICALDNWEFCHLYIPVTIVECISSIILRVPAGNQLFWHLFCKIRK